jgi:hypothetical protein
MKIACTALVLAALSVPAVAVAGTVELGSIAVTYDNALGTPIVNGGQINWTFDPIEPGQLAFSFDIQARREALFSVQFSTNQEFGFDPPGADAALELSVSQAVWNVSLTDLDTAIVHQQSSTSSFAPLVANFDLDRSAEGRTLMRLDGSYSFTGGHWLLASLDPSCASFDCMTLAQRITRISGYQLTLAVPEPSVAIALLAGLALAAWGTKRRMNALPG